VKGVTFAALANSSFVSCRRNATPGFLADGAGESNEYLSDPLPNCAAG
jgi:hypothetical protein